MTSGTVPAQRALWIGTYPADGAAPGSGEGVWRVGLDTGSGRFGTPELAVSTASASFVALHPSGRTLYVVSETAPGVVSAFTVDDDGGLTLSGSAPTGGAEACHVLATPDRVWIANYGDGVAACLPVDPASGALDAEQPATFPHAGSGPDGDRQEGPHAHFVAVVGQDALVADLGTDQLRRYAADGAATEPSIAAALPPGTGPRHLVALPDGALVVAGELDARLHVLRPAGGGWEQATSVPAADMTAPGGAPSFPSHIELSADAGLVTVGVRGADVLAVHRVHPAGTDGGDPTLEHLGDVPLGEGAWPRHHAVLEDGAGAMVVVADQGRRELVAIRLDLSSGRGDITDRVELPTPPACVVEA